MLNDTAAEHDICGIIEIEEYTLVFGEHAMVVEHTLAICVDADLLVLTVVVERAVEELAILAAVEVHDVVGAVEDFGVLHREVRALAKFDALRAATVEAAVGDAHVATVIEAQHAVGAVALVGVAEVKIGERDVLAADEGKYIDVAGRNLNALALVIGRANNEVLEAREDHLRTVEVFFVKQTGLSGTRRTVKALQLAGVDHILNGGREQETFLVIDDNLAVGAESGEEFFCRTYIDLLRRSKCSNGREEHSDKRKGYTFHSNRGKIRVNN